MYNFFELGILDSRFYAAKNSPSMSADDVIDELNNFSIKLEELDLLFLKEEITNSKDPFDFESYFEKQNKRKEKYIFRLGRLSFALFLLAPTKHTVVEIEIKNICKNLNISEQIFEDYYKDLQSEKNSAFKKVVINIKFELENTNITQTNQNHQLNGVNEHVFISYSSIDKNIANAVCNTLESHKIKCWMAPRDILPGHSYGEDIISGIENAKIFLLVFSNNAQQSIWVKKEVERAISKGLIIIPFRIEDIVPTKEMEFYISNSHWLDAFTEPMEKHILELKDTIYKNLKD
jgi:hypothetical protein